MQSPWHNTWWAQLCGYVPSWFNSGKLYHLLSMLEIIFLMKQWTVAFYFFIFFRQIHSFVFGLPLVFIIFLCEDKKNSILNIVLNAVTATCVVLKLCSYPHLTWLINVFHINSILMVGQDETMILLYSHFFLLSVVFQVLFFFFFYI